VLSTYQEIRDRIYQLARQHELSVRWVETTKSVRLVHLVDADEVVVARATVPVRRMDPDLLAQLSSNLEVAFGKDWTE